MSKPSATSYLMQYMSEELAALASIARDDKQDLIAYLIGMAQIEADLCATGQTTADDGVSDPAARALASKIRHEARRAA